MRVLGGKRNEDVVMNKQLGMAAGIPQARPRELFDASAFVRTQLISCRLPKADNALFFVR